MKDKDLPLSNLQCEGGMINIFRRIGCIGDSLSSGEFEFDNNGEKGWWDCYEYSWGKYIERFTGIKVTNYSKGGLTAAEIYEDADKGTSSVESINNMFNHTNNEQAYIIALAVNDTTTADNFERLYNRQIGDAKTDINSEDYNKNAQTFVGAYAKIIQRIQSFQPDAKFFLVTLPDYNQFGEPIRNALNGITEKLENCYLIDLFTYAPKYDAEFYSKYFCGGHMNAAGYLLTARYIMSYISWIIEHNLDDFKYVQFIGTDKKPFDENK